MKPLIKIGAGKGKLLRVTNEYLGYLGLEPIDQSSRKLLHTRETDKCILEISLLRWEDIKQYANNFDLIIFGSDQWLESGKKSMIALKHFEQKNCRLSLLVPSDKKDYSMDYFLDHKIATGYPQLAKNYLGINEENIVKMTGSVEVAVQLGWAQSIFDIVESGETAKENGLVEKKTLVKFGAVLATTRSESISTYMNLGLIKMQERRHIIAFDGVDGSGKSSLAKHFVQEGLAVEGMKNEHNPVVLVCPYSGYIGNMAESLLNHDKCMAWAQLVGEHHWRPTDGVDMVYDRSILTALAELISRHEDSKENVIKIVRAFEPLPDIIFVCKAPIETLEARLRNREIGSRNKYDTLESLNKYIGLYDKAVEIVQKYINGLKIVELDTSVNIQYSIENVKKELKF